MSKIFSGTEYVTMKYTNVVSILMKPTVKWEYQAVIFIILHKQPNIKIIVVLYECFYEG